MTFREYKFFIASDLYRYCAQISISHFLRCFVFVPGFRYTCFMRSARYFRGKRFPLLILHGFSRLALHHYEYKYGICIPYNTEIGYGIYIGHHGGIVVSHKSQIGNNCNINHGLPSGRPLGGNIQGHLSLAIAST